MLILLNARFMMSVGEMMDRLDELKNYLKSNLYRDVGVIEGENHTIFIVISYNVVFICYPISKNLILDEDISIEFIGNEIIKGIQHI